MLPEEMAVLADMLAGQVPWLGCYWPALSAIEPTVSVQNEDLEESWSWAGSWSWSGSWSRSGSWSGSRSKSGSRSGSRSGSQNK